MSRLLHAWMVYRVGDNVWQILVDDSAFQIRHSSSQVDTNVSDVSSYIHKEDCVITIALARQGMDQISISPLECTSLLWQPLHEIFEVVRICCKPFEQRFVSLVTFLDRASLPVIDIPELILSQEARYGIVRRTQAVESVHFSVSAGMSKIGGTYWCLMPLMLPSCARLFVHAEPAQHPALGSSMILYAAKKRRIRAMVSVSRFFRGR